MTGASARAGTADDHDVEDALDEACAASSGDSRGRRSASSPSALDRHLAVDALEEAREVGTRTPPSRQSSSERSGTTPPRCWRTATMISWMPTGARSPRATRRARSRAPRETSHVRGPCPAHRSRPALMPGRFAAASDASTRRASARCRARARDAERRAIERRESSDSCRDEEQAADVTRSAAETFLAAARPRQVVGDHARERHADRRSEQHPARCSRGRQLLGSPVQAER